MNFSIGLMLSKAVSVGVRFVISLIGADTLSKYGITIDQTVLAGGILVALEGLRNYLKINFGDKLGFFKFILN